MYIEKIQNRQVFIQIMTYRYKTYQPKSVEYVLEDDLNEQNIQVLDFPVFWLGC